jgi:hypothetical protein
MSSIFISYSSKDRDFTSKLATDLKSKGLNVWYDQWELKVGDSIIGKIGAAIKAQDYLVVVLSKASVKSQWVIKELGTGLMRELEEKRVVVLPVVIDDCDIPPLLSDKVYADFRSSYSSGLDRLLDAFPGRLFPSGISIPARKALPSNVFTDNVKTTNINDYIAKT